MNTDYVLLFIYLASFLLGAFVATTSRFNMFTASLGWVAAIILLIERMAK